MTIRITPARRVACSATVPLPLSATSAWGQLRHFQSSATHDPFHARVDVAGGVPRAGAELVIEHRYWGWRTVRVGRIVRWREGVGFAFSDLSAADARRAFPHVLAYRLEPAGDRRCRLLVRVTGRWTLPGPRWVGHVWLRWVFGHVVRTVRNDLLRYAVAMDRRPRDGPI